MKTRRIRNVSGVRRVLPTLHKQADPGQEIQVPASLALPYGFAEAAAKAKAAPDNENEHELAAEQPPAETA